MKPADLPFTVLCGLPDPREAAAAPALRPFDPRVTAFLADLSAALLTDPRSRAYPDVATFAFFCRRANVEGLREACGDLSGRLGRGLVFHVAPGNVPMNFAYSLVSALLAGDASVVKAPSRAFAQTALTCEAVNGLLAGEHAALRPYVNVVTYPRERQEATEAFSALCDVRVVWGGDETIRRVRQAPLPPRSTEVTFADRWSLTVADARAVADMDEKALAAAAQGFYNDTYLLDQHACTAPRLVYWLGEGEALARAQERFWAAVHAYAAPRYPIDPVAAVDKLTVLYRAALTLPGAALAPMPDNLVFRIRLNALTPAVLDLQASGGCFPEYASASLNDLVPLMTAKTQTVSVLGVDPHKVRDLALSAGVRGVDRVVPVGRTLDFSLVWDGYDLIRALSRAIAAG
jgi:hypothetical protein